MSKISNKELAEALTEKHGLSKQDAEKFVAKMFEELGSGLQSDKQVKIKGLGTFKVISVASRKSVDVNTGEPIVIDGRDKISFTPDASLRDDVNRPFAQFDTVVLNDGVDFSEIDKKYADSETDNDKESNEQKNEELKDENNVSIKEPTDERQVEEQEPISTVNEQTKEANAPLESSTEDNASTEQSTEDNAPVQSTEVNTPVQSTEDNTPEPSIEGYASIEETKEQDDQIEQKKENINTLSEQEPTEVENKEEIETEVEEEIETSQHRTLKYVCIAASVVIILLGAGAFYLYNQLQLRDNRIENLEAQIFEKKKNKTVAPQKNSNAIATTKTQDIVSSDAKAGKNNIGQVEKDKIKANEATSPKNSSEDNNDYNKDARVRTGAYNIVGIDHTVKVKEGQTLSSISRSQLGPGMECYIEAVNGWKKEFKAGENVNIPKLKLKKKK